MSVELYHAVPSTDHIQQLLHGYSLVAGSGIGDFTCRHIGVIKGGIGGIGDIRGV